MALEGLHHITAITADAPRNVDFYARAARAADGQEDRQLRRARRLPPLLRRRARHARLDPHVLRVPRRGAAGSAGDGMVHTIQWRVGAARRAGLLGASGWATSASRPSARARAALRRLRGPAPRARRRRRAPTRRCAAQAPDIPAEHALLRLPRRARVRRAPRGAARGLLEALGFRAQATTARGAARRRSATRLLHYDAPPAGAGARARAPIHHVAWSAADDAELERVPRARDRGRRATRRRSSTASTSTRSTSASPAACCSSSPAATSASTSTSRSRRSAQALKLPPQYERLRDAARAGR